MDLITPAATLQPYTVIGPNGQPAQADDPNALGQGDFLRLLTTQLEQQDPFEPVDNTQMLAQMAQFSALAGSAETNDTLKQILGKLDNLIAVQTSEQTVAAEATSSNQE